MVELTQALGVLSRAIGLDGLRRCAEQRLGRLSSTITSAESQPTGANRPMSYAQVIGVVNALCDARDRIVTAAGGLPAEVAANWRTKSPGTVDVEFGFSCMGYEIAGGWGARIAQAENEPERDTIVLVGDGSYLMLNSDLYSSVLTGKKLIVIVCDNGGFAVIHKLQIGTGNVPLQQPHQGLPGRRARLRGRFRRPCPRAWRRQPRLSARSQN